MYRGPDRRRSAQAHARDPFDWSYRVTVAVLFVGFVAALVDRRGIGSADELQQQLAVAAAGLVASAVAFLVLRWRLTSHTTSAWTALCLAGVAATVFLSETEVVDLGAGSVGRTVPLALAVATATAAVVLLSLPEVDTRLRFVEVLGGLALTGLAIAAATAVLAALEIGLPAPGDGGQPAVTGVLVVAWSSVAAVWSWKGRTRRDWALVWGGLLFVTLAGSAVAELAASAAHRQPGPASAALLAMGGVVALRGSAEGLREAIDAQARELSATRVRMDEEQSQAAHARAAAEERAHEARNALHAVGAAIKTLERFHERLDDDTKTKLSVGVAFELERLQRLIEVDEWSEAPCVFAVSDAIDPVVLGAESDGLSVDVDISPELIAIGQPRATAGIVQNLLVNARRHAGGRDVAVRAYREDHRVVVTVSDGGPGVPPSDRELVFARGRRDAVTGGSGFGLYVSRRLARAQGGDLWVADRPGGGAVFGFDLPASVSRDVVRAGSDDARDEVGDARDA